MEQRKSNKFLRFLSWMTGAAAGGILLYGGLIEPNRLTVRRTVIELPDLPHELEGCRIHLVADTHFGSSFIDKLRRDRLLRSVAEEKADVCFLLGDYIAVGSLPHYGAMSEEDLLAFFRGLKAPLGTYAVLGNHELWYGRKRMSSLLEKAGVKVVENKSFKLKGLLPAAGVPESSTAEFDRKKFNQFLEKEKPLILLTHKGGILRYLKLPPQAVLFAADTHGGQVRIPGGPSLKSFLSGKKELAPGLSERWGRRLFITTGAGGHRLGFRLFCPPETAVVTLTKKKAEKI